ncbi:MAG: hypothetical protein GY757_16930, partial [bacterium]|nr:hypothetical protein [bacterium]
MATYEVVYAYDDNGNRKRLTYPSGMVIDIDPDELDRIHTVKLGHDTITEYIYEGKAKVSKKKLSNEAVVMSAGYDKGKRPESLTYKAGSNVLFEKIMSWTLANMKLSEGKGPVGAVEKEKEYKYDTAKRLRKEEKFKENMVSGTATFDVDDVENLSKVGASDSGMSLDTDHNERHQITSADYKRTVGNTALKVHVEPEYDNNGNMTRFVHGYTYNCWNQLLTVTSGTGVNVEYKYDALGRRIGKTVTDPNSEVKMRYILDGWRVIEEREILEQNDIVTARYTYGNGIDERVRLEYLENGGLVPYIPMQDTTGNVIGIADSEGKLVETYDYSTYGMPKFKYDITPPQITDVGVSGGAIKIRASEPIHFDIDNIKNAVSIDVSGVDVSFNVEVSDDLEEITLILPEGSLPHGNLGVNIDTTLEDKAGNKLATQFNVQSGYQGGDAVLYNVSGPEVVKIVYKKTNEFRIKFNQKVAPGSIENSVEIKKTDGSITGTITMVDDRTLDVDLPETLILGHEYQIWVKALLTDDSGMAANEFFHRFVVMDDDMLI